MPKLLHSIAFFIAAAVILLPSFAHAQSRRVAPTPTPEEAVKVRTEEIKLNVLAFDEEGNFVNDVAAKDLVITEDNILHQPSSVRRLPANVLIVMDTGGELRSQKSLDKTRSAAAGVVSALKAEDSVAILQYSDKAEVVAEWTSNKDEIFKSINRTEFGRRSAFVKALGLAKDFLTKSGLDNKHMVLITDGTDSFTDYATKQRAMRDLLASDITVHVISYTRMEANDISPRTKAVSNTPPPKALPDEVVAGLPNGVRQTAQAPKIGPTINMDRKLLKTLRARKADLETAEEQLTELANNSNGEIIVPLDKDEMLAKTGLIARMIDSSYVVTYTPKIPIEDAGTERDIIVTSKRPGLVVEARRKLLIPSDRR